MENEITKIENEKGIMEHKTTIPKREKRSRSKKIVITSPSVTVNGKEYGISVMQTVYSSSMPIPGKEDIQLACSNAYMNILKLFTGEN